jgi:AcrR family transcriptional regulator
MMNLASKSDVPATSAHFDAPASEEQRSSNQMAEAARDLLLQRSRQIVDAAYELVEEKGLDGLTIRAILEKTGLSRRAFYERFSGKDDVVLAVFEQTIRLAADHYSEQVAPLPDAMERLKLIVTCIVLGKSSLLEADKEQISHRGAAMSREHLRLAESRPDELQAALSPLLTLIAQLLSDGMKAGLVRDYAPQRLAVLVYNLVSTTVHTELLAHETVKPDRTRRAQLATDIWEFCRRAITA